MKKFGKNLLAMMAMTALMVTPVFAGVHTAPTGISASQSGNDVVISWNAVDWEGADQYQVTIYRSDANGANTKTYKSINVSGSETETDITIKSKGYYVAKVRAKDVQNKYTDYSTASGVITVTSDDLGIDTGFGSPRVHNSATPGANGSAVQNTTTWINGVPYNTKTQVNSTLNNDNYLNADGSINYAAKYGGNAFLGPGNGSTPAASLGGGAGNAGAVPVNSSTSMNPAKGVGYSSSNPNPKLQKKMITVNTYANTGWQFETSGMWYLDEDGTYPVSCWKSMDGGFRHFNEKGYLEVNRWVYENNGHWYYANAEGKMSLGWTAIGGKWYYFNPQNGQLVGPGIQMIDGKYYYIGTDGARMENNWVGAYYFGQDGARIN